MQSARLIFDSTLCEMMKGYPAFYKGKYHTGGDPFNDPHLQIVLNSEESKKYCTHKYVLELIETK